MSGYTAYDLPQYIKVGEGYEDFVNYYELVFQVLSTILNSNGFLLPILTATQVTALAALTDIPLEGRLFLNSTTNKLQFIDTTGTVRTITST